MKLCRARAQSDWNTYACSNKSTRTITYQGRTVSVCGIHARQFERWIRIAGRDVAEQWARTSWNWRDFTKEQA